MAKKARLDAHDIAVSWIPLPENEVVLRNTMLIQRAGDDASKLAIARQALSEWIVLKAKNIKLETVSNTDKKTIQLAHARDMASAKSDAMFVGLTGRVKIALEKGALRYFRDYFTEKQAALVARRAFILHTARPEKDESLADCRERLSKALDRAEEERANQGVTLTSWEIPEGDGTRIFNVAFSSHYVDKPINVVKDHSAKKLHRRMKAAQDGAEFLKRNRVVTRKGKTTGKVMKPAIVTTTQAGEVVDVKL